MAGQDLDGAQISFGFEQGCGEAMPQGMRMDLPVIETGSFSGDLTGRPWDLGGHRAPVTEFRMENYSVTSFATMKAEMHL